MMEIILIILTSTILSALLVGAFFMGYKLGQGKPKGVTLTKKNAESIADIAKFINYGG